MQQHLDQTQSKVLPIVLPLVFYHGKEPYPYSTDIFDLFGEQKNLAKSILLKPFHLIDVGTIPDEELRKRQWAGLMEFTMKHVFARDMLPLIRAIMPQLKKIEHLGENEYIKHIFHYLITVGNIYDAEGFREVLMENLSPNMGAEIMTFADRLKAKGIEEGVAIGIKQGIEQGINQGINIVATNLIQKNIPLSTITELTGLTVAQIKALIK
jgi:predicted transposase/invertase (TIGR01784 family)